MISLPEGAPLAEYQRYIHELETMHGWLDVDLIHNCFLMGEELGELFKAVRKHVHYFDQTEEAAPASDAAAEAVADELVDIMNYLLAIANRLEIDMESAFVRKNARNQQRRWQGATP